MVKQSSTLARELLEELKKQAEKKQEMADLNAKITGMTMGLYNAMEDEGITKIETEEGITFKQAMKLDYHLNSEASSNKFDDCPEFFDWLETQGLGGIIKQKKSVAPGTRKKVLTEHVADNKQLPNFIEEKSFNTVDHNKSAVARLVKKGG